MKKEMRTITKTEEVKVYIAGDGKEFSDEETCKIYEESAEFAFWTLLINKCLFSIQCKGYLSAGDFAILFDDPCNCGDYYIFKPKTSDDIKNMIGYAKCKSLVYEHSPERLEWLKETYFTLHEWLEPGKEYVVCINNENGNATFIEKYRAIEKITKFIDFCFSDEARVKEVKNENSAE